ncbi:MAG: hypothetical protein O3B95_09555, partial [Chloroflexi bacterium]|nr:hypothetical protein [Chloroflexota bacterium]
MEQLLRRMLGAAKLDRATYEEVEEDTTATRQAVLVVIIVSVASGIGGLGVAGPIGILYGIVLGLVGWALFAALAYWIGVNLLPKTETHANWGQVARGLAFARSPGVLFAFGIVGFATSALGSLVLFVVGEFNRSSQHLRDGGVSLWVS